MQNSDSESLALDIMKKLKKYFGEKVGEFSIYGVTDTPYQMFHMKFTAYKYFRIIFNYDRGSFGCNIIGGGGESIELENSQKWYDKADINVFLKELEQQIELRIPDKFLEFNGWK